MNALLDALGSVGYALDTPGAYLRGALAGKPGDRASGQDLLSSYGLSSADDPWGGLKGFGVEAVLDPLSLIGPATGALKGISAGTKAARVLAHADDVNPLAKAVARFAGDESGALKPFAHVLPSARSKELAGQVGTDPWFLRSYAEDLTPEKLNPLRHPTNLSESGLGNVRGIRLHHDPDELMDVMNYRPTREEMLRDLTHAPGGWREGKWGETVVDPRMDEDALHDLWHRTFINESRDPALYELNVDPQAVLDISRGGPSVEPGTELGQVGQGFAEKLWQARQQATQAQGIDWPKTFTGLGEGKSPRGADTVGILSDTEELRKIAEAIPELRLQGRDQFGFDEKLSNWVDPYGHLEVYKAHPIGRQFENFLGNDPYRFINQLGEMNHDFERALERLPRNFWQQDNPLVQALLESGANRDLLRSHLTQQGYGALWKPAGETHGFWKGQPNIDPASGLNVLDPRIISSFQRVE